MSRFVVAQTIETRSEDSPWSEFAVFSEEDYLRVEAEATNERQQHDYSRVTNHLLGPYVPRYRKAGVLEGLVRNDRGIVIHAAGKILNNPTIEVVRQKMNALQKEVGLDAAAMEGLIFTSIPLFTGYKPLRGKAYLMPDTREASERGANLIFFVNSNEVPYLNQRKVYVSGQEVMNFSSLSIVPDRSMDLPKAGELTVLRKCFQHGTTAEGYFLDAAPKTIFR